MYPQYIHQFHRVLANKNPAVEGPTAQRIPRRLRGRRGSGDVQRGAGGVSERQPLAGGGRNWVVYGDDCVTSHTDIA